MRPTNGMDRAQFHDKAWALWQEKAFESALLPKLSIHAIRTMWDVLYDSMPTETVSEAAINIDDDLKATDGPLLELDFLLANLHEDVWESAIHSLCAYDEAGKNEARAIQRLVRSMIAVERAASLKAVALTDPFEQAICETYRMVDPFNPPPAGSYSRGVHEGIIAALKTVRENFSRALLAATPAPATADARDAARYRWLSRQAVATRTYEDHCNRWEVDYVLRGTSFGAAIDAAMHRSES